MNEPLHPLQALVNAMNEQQSLERAKTQLTLGELIASLKALPPDTPVANLCHSHSYRGYYTDLAFELCEGDLTAFELLTECEQALGEVFQGYKGGDFTMHRRTPLWVANYGCCGLKLIAVHAGGEIETAEDDYS